MGGVRDQGAEVGDGGRAEGSGTGPPLSSCPLPTRGAGAPVSPGSRTRLPPARPRACRLRARAAGAARERADASGATPGRRGWAASGRGRVRLTRSHRGAGRGPIQSNLQRLHRQAARGDPRPEDRASPPSASVLGRPEGTRGGRRRLGLPGCSGHPPHHWRLD